MNLPNFTVLLVLAKAMCFSREELGPGDEVANANDTDN